MEETIREIIRECLYYGYYFRFMVENYPIFTEFGVEKARVIYNEIFQEMGEDF